MFVAGMATGVVPIFPFMVRKFAFQDHKRNYMRDREKSSVENGNVVESMKRIKVSDTLCIHPKPPVMHG